MAKHSASLTNAVHITEGVSVSVGNQCVKTPETASCCIIENPTKQHQLISKNIPTCFNSKINFVYLLIIVSLNMMINNYCSHFLVFLWLMISSLLIYSSSSLEESVRKHKQGSCKYTQASSTQVCNLQHSNYWASMIQCSTAYCQYTNLTLLIKYSF